MKVFGLVTSKRMTDSQKINNEKKLFKNLVRK